MKRSRAYYRHERERVIHRKRKILLLLGGQWCYEGWTKGAEGRLAKNKIHCSCPMCRMKSSEYPTMRDLRAMDRGNDMVREYLREEEANDAGDDFEQAERN